MQSPKVLIVGSGPAGLVLALSLLKNGIPVRIIEKDTHHHVGERGPGVVPRTLEIEHFLAVADDIRKAGTGCPTLHFFDPDDPHRIIRSSNMVEEVQSTPTYPITQGVMLGQWRHQAVLRRHIEALGVKVELGTAFDALNQDENGVTADILRMVDGVKLTEKASFEYIVGADGGRSTVRKAMGINFLGETREEGQMYIIDIRMQGLKGEKDLYLWGSQSTTLVALRHTVEPGLFQLIFSGPKTKFDVLKERNDKETVQLEFNRATGRTDLLITEIVWQGEWRPNLRMADHFQVGRVFIIGDAAHTHSPTGGQGLNSSVQDAFNLGWKLALSIKGLASTTLLESYDSERLPVIAEMLKLTTELYNRHVKSEIQQAEILRQAARQQSQVAQKEIDEVWFRGRKLFQLDIHYRWSSIVIDERFSNSKLGPADVYGVVDHDVRHAGDRAPDAPALIGRGVPSRLFDIFSPALHTILIFATTQSAVIKARALLEPFAKLEASLMQKVFILPVDDQLPTVSFMESEYAVVDSEGHAFGGYGLSSTDDVPTVVVVRPDAMIGAFLRSEAGAREYLSAVFKLGD